MTEKNAIYISSITGGKCIENTQKDKGECRLRKWIKTTEQQWIVESSESDATTVAFRSVSDQQYLAALQPDKRNGGKIGVQAEKQWWTLEPGMGPGWWHVKSNSSFGGGKAGYLNDEWGRWKDDNKLQTYEYEVSGDQIGYAMRTVRLCMCFDRPRTLTSTPSTFLLLRLLTAGHRTSLLLRKKIKPRRRKTSMRGSRV